MALRTRAVGFMGLVMVLILLMSYSTGSRLRAVAPFDLGNSDSRETEPSPVKIPSSPSKSPITKPPTAKSPGPDSKLTEPSHSQTETEAALPSSSTPPPPPPPPPPDPSHPAYKPERNDTFPLVVDSFPVAAAAHSSADLPPIPPWNKPPHTHIEEQTPLFIGFTRNWPLLQQTVVSYITAGWPPEDIYVVENTGTMKSNELGLLSMQNPFFLNHTRLRLLDVNIITTPTLLTFSQLQNFFLWTAIDKNFTEYFWGHMDMILLPFEESIENAASKDDNRFANYKSPYGLAVDVLKSSREGDKKAGNSTKPWALRFFAYDRFALVKTAAYESVGGYDNGIPYYSSDCDFHDRLAMHGYDVGDAKIIIGNFSDAADSLDDLIVLYRLKDSPPANFTIDGDPDQEMREWHEKQRGWAAEAERKKAEAEEEKKQRLNQRDKESHKNKTWVHDVPGSAIYQRLRLVARQIDIHKNFNGGDGRNYWQRKQNGGKGEPYYRDAEGFETVIKMMTQMGKNVYTEKWGHRDCGLVQLGRKESDQWRVEHDWA